MDKKREMVEFQAGEVISLLDGSEVEVVSNPRDGAWLLCQPTDGSAGPEPVFWTEVIFSESP